MFKLATMNVNFWGRKANNCRRGQKTFFNDQFLKLEMISGFLIEPKLLRVIFFFQETSLSNGYSKYCKKTRLIFAQNSDTYY